MPNPPSEHQQTPRLSRDSADLLVRQVARAAARSVPLPDVLEALADDSGDRRLSSAAYRLADRLRAGASIDEALAAEKGAFPRHIRGVLSAGVRANNVPVVLEGYAALELERRNINSTVRSALAYPILIAILLVPVLLLLSMYLAPMFEDLFNEFDLDLPEVTLVAFRTARIAPFAISALLVVPAGLAVMLSLMGGHWLLHRLRGAVPVFGPLWTWAGQSEFASLLETMVAAGLPLPDAIEATADALTDRSIARACPHLIRGLEAGVPLGELVDRSMHFDRLIGPMIAWGEQHGVLGESLRLVGQMMRTRVANYAAMLRRVVPVVTLVVVATFIVGIAVIGFLLPLVNLISGLSGGVGLF